MCANSCVRAPDRTSASFLYSKCNTLLLAARWIPSRIDYVNIFFCLSGWPLKTSKRARSRTVHNRQAPVGGICECAGVMTARALASPWRRPPPCPPRTAQPPRFSHINHAFSLDGAPASPINRPWRHLQPHSAARGSLCVPMAHHAERTRAAAVHQSAAARVHVSHLSRLS